ncbi:hypothetical protein [Streptomyces sp. CBMA370]|uniref:hypothetical protein n=1 Tax=Streptomyces sp. CBMA370 TaxID=1930278 RepID=UPI001661EC64|nr:hypothetical protein [Streptomyces sp. CBMA370]MBD0716062.1 hypothetical protein [Streptomyces sp. CBMA370]
MFVFACAGCGGELTTPLYRVALPAHARQTYGNGIQLPVLMEAGTFAEEPEPWGPSWRDGAGLPPDGAGLCPGGVEGRGVRFPVPVLSGGGPGSIVLAPGDVRGTVPVPERLGGTCCGLDGTDGPNLACDACGRPVASRIDDCSLWQAVRLVPHAVRRLPVGGPAPAPLTWAELLTEGKSTPLFEPIATWGGHLGTGHFWSWSPRWEAAAGWTLAHLVAASEGRPVTVPDGLSKDVFRRALDSLLPPGAPPRRAVLAGPGRPRPDADADIVLVPTHPRTGRWWTPADPAACTASPVPLPFGVWLCLAFPRPHLPVPASGGLPDGVLRDDPLPPRPGFVFRPDRDVFRRTLARLPHIGRPWMRTVRDRSDGPLRQPF